MPGPPPKPSAMRELEGDRSKRKPKKEVTPAKGTPLAPSTLDREAAAEWRRVVPKLAEIEMLSKVDRAALAEYCATWSMLQHYRALLRKEGHFLTSLKGHEYPHPAAAMIVKLSPVLRAYLSEFGLTPAARARLAVEVTEKAPAEPMDATAKAKAKWLA